jgi:hypothetical protein
LLVICLQQAAVVEEEQELDVLRTNLINGVEAMMGEVDAAAAAA